VRAGLEAKEKAIGDLKTYPLLTVKLLKESRNYYLECFEMTVVFEANWEVMLSHGKDAPITLGLMSTNHPPGRPVRKHSMARE
jgi:hypothetical protein